MQVFLYEQGIGKSQAHLSGDIDVVYCNIVYRSVSDYVISCVDLVLSCDSTNVPLITRFNTSAAKRIMAASS